MVTPDEDYLSELCDQCVGPFLRIALLAVDQAHSPIDSINGTYIKHFDWYRGDSDDIEYDQFLQCPPSLAVLKSMLLWVASLSDKFEHNFVPVLGSNTIL